MPHRQEVGRTGLCRIGQDIQRAPVLADRVIWSVDQRLRWQSIFDRRNAAGVAPNLGVELGNIRIALEGQRTASICLELTEFKLLRVFSGTDALHVRHRGSRAISSRGDITADEQ